MHPVSEWITEYSDAFLNGLEIFKISDSQGNLAGPNLDPVPPPPGPPKDLAQKHARKTRSKILIGVIVGVAASILVLISSIAFFLINRGKNVKSGDGTFKCVQFTTTKSVSIIDGSIVPTKRCHHFSITKMRAATNNFDDLFIIGVGGFGNVYKGYIDHGHTPVAIKRLKQGSQQGPKEFQTEIEMLSHLQHHHLVSLIGFYNDDSEMILVYEFMASGTFRDHLYDSENQPLSWKQGLEICLGAVRGLHYLYIGAKHAIIHRDIKTTNILIDENWMAKILDFGLSKIGPTGVSRSNINISTLVKGSIGYLDSEYYTLQILTNKSDVYSFGVVLLEVLFGRPPIVHAVEREWQNLVEWFRRSVDENKIIEAVDPILRESMTPKCLKAYTEIALKCLANNGNERPSMGDVMLGLESLLELLNKAEKTKFDGTLNKEITVEEEGSLFSG